MIDLERNKRTNVPAVAQRDLTRSYVAMTGTRAAFLSMERLVKGVLHIGQDGIPAGAAEIALEIHSLLCKVEKVLGDCIKKTALDAQNGAAVEKGAENRVYYQAGLNF